MDEFDRTKEWEEYSRLRKERDNIIAANRSKRMKGKDTLPVPPKPCPPMGYEMLVDGRYEGFVDIDDKQKAIARFRDIMYDAGYRNLGKITAKRIQSPRR